MSSNNHFDTIVLGAGPISILEALYQHKLGKSVAIITDDSVIGGAWKTIQHPNLPELEIGCHIWDNDQAVFDFFNNYLNLNIQPLKPSPQISYKGINFPYDWKNIAFRASDFIKRIKRESHNKAPLNIIPKKYYYPTGGATDLVEALKIKLTKTNIVIFTNTTLQSIKVESENSIFLGCGTQSYQCSDFIFTNLGRINKLTVQGSEVNVSSPTKVDYIHNHLVISDSKKDNFSYVRTYSNPSIHRISDITHQLKNNSKNERIIVAGIHQAVYSKTKQKELSDSILEYLKTNKLVNQTASIKASHWNVFPSYYINLDSIKEILENNSNINQLHSTNLIHGISQQLEKWKILLD